MANNVSYNRAINKGKKMYQYNKKVKAETMQYAVIGFMVGFGLACIAITVMINGQL